MSRRARARARALWDDLGLDAPEQLDLELVAAHSNVFVKTADLSDEEAYLLRRGTRGLVVLAERTRGSHKGRFILAHELGHWFLHPDLDEVARCTGIGARPSGGLAYETEASAFAEELLLPRHLCAPMCNGEQPTLDDVSRMADRFHVSLTAASIRFVRLAEAACAIVCSRAGKVEWAAGSRRFESKMAKGQAPGGASFARLVEAGERAPARMLPVDPRAWGMRDEVELMEQARPAGAVVLSWLWHAPL